jgi:hypothetical protein
MEIKIKESLLDAKTVKKLGEGPVYSFFLTLPPKPMKKSVPFTVSPGLKINFI